MRRKLTLRIMTLLIFTLITLSSLQAQKGQDTSSFVRDQNRPFVYLKFDHIGVGVRRAAEEPSTRIWLKFVNNCNAPIRLRVYGVPDGSVTGEVGVMDDVVRNRPMLTITAGNSSPDVEHESSAGNDAVRTTEASSPQITEMPSGYLSEVSGAVQSHRGDLYYLAFRLLTWVEELRSGTWRFPSGSMCLKGAVLATRWLGVSLSCRCGTRSTICLNRR